MLHQLRGAWNRHRARRKRRSVTPCGQPHGNTSALTFLSRRGSDAMLAVDTSVSIELTVFANRSFRNTSRRTGPCSGKSGTAHFAKTVGSDDPGSESAAAAAEPLALSLDSSRSRRTAASNHLLQPRRRPRFVSMGQRPYLHWYPGLGSTGSGDKGHDCTRRPIYFSSLTLTNRICPAWSKLSIWSMPSLSKLILVATIMTPCPLPSLSSWISMMPKG